MIFANPGWLFGLLVLPALVLLELAATRRDHDRTARLVSRGLWTRVVRRPGSRLRFVRLALVVVGAAGTVLALARPQWGIVREKVEREGVDVVLALDSSGSMATEDVPPNRFFLARQALLSLIGRLEGDRFGLLAFEGEAYPLVPLTLDADAVGLFLDSTEPGLVPSPGTSLGSGLAKGLEMFVDKERHNKVLVLVSDGEDLEGDIPEAVKRAKEAGIVVHTVGVGTEKGEPVPDFDKEGNRVGFKKDESGSPVVSRLNAQNLEAIARGTGGRFFMLTPADTSLSGLAAAIEGLEQKSLSREFSYRRKEQFQVPLAAALVAFVIALLLPLPSLAALRTRRAVPAETGKASRGRARRASAAAAVLVLVFGADRLRAQSATASPSAEPPVAPAPGGGPGEPQPSPAPAAREKSPASRVLDEVLLRPRRLTEHGRNEYERGNHPQALGAFEEATRTRPADQAARFNLADALYKNGKYDEAAVLYDALGKDPRAPLAAPSRFNLGNARYQKQDYKGAVEAYKGALDLHPDDPDVRRNLELALRAIKKQQEEQQRQQQQQKQDDKKDQKQQQDQKPNPQKDPKDQKGEPKKDGKPDRPKTPEEKEQERFQQETGMPKDRAMQLLDALQQGEKAEQKRLLAARRAVKKTKKDW
jgi:Ca-activated chloride channel homolog